MRRCVGSAWVLVLVNSPTSNKFKMERGLRYGCPLSLMLFNLVAEALPIQGISLK